MQHMLRLIMNPGESQVMAFLGKLRKFLAALGMGDTLLLPAMVDMCEMVILVERTNEQLFRFVIIQTDPERGTIFVVMCVFFWLTKYAQVLGTTL